MTYCWAVGLLSGLACLALILTGIAAALALMCGASAARDYLTENIHPPKWLRVVGNTITVLAFIPIVGMVLILGPHELGCFVRTHGFWAIFHK